MRSKGGALCSNFLESFPWVAGSLMIALGGIVVVGPFLKAFLALLLGEIASVILTINCFHYISFLEIFLSSPIPTEPSGF